MARLTAVSTRGQAAGTKLTPHRYADGHFIVSMTRFSRDYVRVSSESDLPAWVQKGYSVRMSNPDVPAHRSPSLSSPSAIQVL